MRNIQYVFFDLDRTLWDFESNSEATLKELFSEFGLTEKLGVSDDDFIHEYKRINELFWEDYRNGVIKKEELRYARFEAAMKFFGHSDRRMASEIGELYISRSPKKTGLVDGCIEVLEYLHSKYALHIITNGFEEVQHIKMKSSGLDPYFGHVITSESAGAKKPDPIIFHHAAELTGAKPENSIMIGDHFEADVIGALEVGWKAVLYEPNKEKSKGTEFLHIQHLTELKEVL
ncbi:MAG: noncanonical pyrimidine nucleotidase, YjjG family [Flavobacteriales bacterium]|nr:noncanonical pyrimidine nucleotidase, YjjG family [Flavobacteriales bacterium]